MVFFFIWQSRVATVPVPSANGTGYTFICIKTRLPNAFLPLIIIYPIFELFRPQFPVLLIDQAVISVGHIWIFPIVFRI